MAKKAAFGNMCTVKVRYVLVVVFSDNSLKYVTDVLYEPHKECRWEDGKQACFFEDRRYAEDICFGLNVNGTGAFVMEVPDYFNDDSFVNPEKKEEAENE